MLLTTVIIILIIMTSCFVYTKEIRELLSNWFYIFAFFTTLNIIHCVEYRRHSKNFDIKMQYISIPLVSALLTSSLQICFAYILYACEWIKHF